MVRIKNEKVITISSSGIASVDAELWASSSEDLPVYDSIAGRELVPGSIAAVPSESKIFVLDFDHEWKEWGAEPEPESSSKALNAASLELEHPSLTLDPVDSAEDLTTDERVSEYEVFGAAESE